MNKLMYKQVFEIVQSNPDPTPYNQQRQIYKPQNACVIVELEITKENFYLPNKFFEELTLWELGTGNKPNIPGQLDFTPLGWSRVMEKLEAPYKAFEPETESQEDDLWEDEEY